MDKVIRGALVVLATARLTRFVTEDSLGHWWLVQPARRWAVSGTSLEGEPAAVIDAEWEHADAYVTPRQKLVSGLDCRWCVGFWLGVLVLLADVVCTRLGPIPRALCTFALSALALNVASNAAGQALHTLP